MSWAGWTDAEIRKLSKQPAKSQPRGDRGPKAHDPMGKWERAFASEVLEPLRLSGDIERWRYEAVKLRLGHRCWYTPDFEIPPQEKRGTYALGGADVFKSTHLYVEVKGHWREDARVKIKGIAARFEECLFVAVTGGPGRWRYEWIQVR